MSLTAPILPGKFLSPVTGCSETVVKTIFCLPPLQSRRSLFLSPGDQGLFCFGLLRIPSSHFLEEVPAGKAERLKNYYIWRLYAPKTD